jgi:ABC-2 type transport system ATP-binding protein
MLLRTEHLTKDYGRYRALDDLNLAVAPGEVFGLLGPNGSGKTTALRLLLGFLRPTRGHAWIGGHECWHDSVAARRLVAYLPGELRLYENMTGRRLVQFLSDLRGHPGRPTPCKGLAPVDALARRFDIDLDRPLANLSSGMKRKVALLQVLVAHASLLIMDEPTNALDPTMRDELLAQVRQARDGGQAVLFSSHVLAEVEQVCDRVAILQRGRLVHLQAMSELRQGRLVRARFRTADCGLQIADSKPQDPSSNPQSTIRNPQLLTLPLPEGLVIRERHDDLLTLQYTGDLPELLTWLARQPLIDLRMEPLGLAAIYHRYHGAVE